MMSRSYRGILGTVLCAIERRTKKLHFIAIGFLVAVFCILDSTKLNLIRGLEYSTYDLVMKYRPYFKSADQDVVIIDVDERTLTALGSWPFKRSTFAMLMDYLESQQARAVVFDFLFAEPNPSDPDGDAYLEEVFNKSSNAYLSMARLDPDGDAEGLTRLSSLKGVSYLHPKEKDEDTTIALTLPYIKQIVASERVGTNPLHVDKDGVLREYQLYELLHQTLIHTVLSQVARQKIHRSDSDTSYENKMDSRILLNWRGKPGAHKRVSFIDVLTSAQSGTNPAEMNFKNKYVIVGSSAAGIVLTKTTPMHSNHAGIDILATALDNLKNQDFIKRLPVKLTLLISLSFIMVVTWIQSTKYSSASLKQHVSRINLLLTLLFVVGLVGFNYYLDLITPLAYGNILTTLFSLYSDRRMAYLANRQVQDGRLNPASEYRLFFVALRCDQLNQVGLNRFIYAVSSTVLSKTTASVVTDWITPTFLMAKDLSDTFLIYWIESESDSQTLEVRQRIHSEFKLIQRAFGSELKSTDYEGTENLQHSGILQSRFTYGATGLGDEFHKAFFGQFGRLVTPSAQRVLSSTDNEEEDGPIRSVA